VLVGTCPVGPIASNNGNFAANTGVLGIPFVDLQEQMRNCICLLWPLSRRNAVVFANIDATSTPSVQANSHACTWTSTGLVNWTVNPPATPSRPCAIYASQQSNTTEQSGNIFVYDGANWYICGLDGLPLRVVQAAPYSFYFSTVVAYPPVLGCILLNAGTAMAGQSFHLELVIHCEYSGLGVQGRGTVTVPDQRLVDTMQASLLHARETTTQNEGGNPIEQMANSAVAIAADHMPEVATGIVTALGAPELAPVAMELGSMAGRALKRFRF